MPIHGKPARFLKKKDIKFVSRYLFERGLHTDAEAFLHLARAACPDDEQNLVVAAILWNLAGISNESNRVREALELCVQVLKIREALLPPNSPVLVNTYYSVGIVYMENGELEKSLEYNLKALRISQDYQDQDQSSTAFTYSNLGLCYRRMRELEEASDCMEKAEFLWRQSCGTGSDRYAM